MGEDVEFRDPPLTDTLKQILEEYPDGGQILKVKREKGNEVHISSPNDKSQKFIHTIP